MIDPDLVTDDQDVDIALFVKGPRWIPIDLCGSRTAQNGAPEGCKRHDDCGDGDAVDDIGIERAPDDP
jgi:hypothetical protein